MVAKALLLMKSSKGEHGSTHDDLVAKSSILRSFVASELAIRASLMISLAKMLQSGLGF
jgi:hypothetical protein